MSDGPRRRRSSDGDSEGSGGLPLFPLVVIVVFAGLLLGGLLAHFFGARRNAAQAVAIVTSPPVSAGLLSPPAMRPAATPAYPPSVEPSGSPSIRAVQKSPAASPSPLPSRSAAPATTPSAAGTPKIPAAVTHRVATGAPVQPTPKTSPLSTGRLAAVTPAPNYVAGGADQAAGIVRSYLGALARGDRATATTYLARGLPGEVFMDPGARVVSLHAEPAGSQYRVTAEIATATGAYYATFTLESGTGGLQIVDHYAIKGH